jgi:hypothetical protein
MKSQYLNIISKIGGWIVWINKVWIEKEQFLKIAKNACLN